MKKELFAIGVFLLAGSFGLADTDPSTAPAIELGYETTWIAEPLRDNGIPDYIASLEKEYGRGVTRENNAAIPIAEGLGPGFFREQVRALSLERLGLHLPDDGHYFAELPDDPKLKESYKLALEGPWNRQDHPQLAAWVEANAAPLERIVAAAQKTRCFFPIVSSSEHLRMFDWYVPKLGRLQSSAKALIIRSNRLLAEGRIDDTWADLLAVHRLAALLEQGPTIIQQAYAIAGHGRAAWGTVQLAHSDKVPLAKLREILSTLPALGCDKTVSVAVDRCERRLSLDTITALATDEKAVTDFGQFIAPRETKEHLAFRRVHRMLFSKDVVGKVDWNHVLRSCNEYYDSMVKAMRMPTYARYVRAYEDLEGKRERFSTKCGLLLRGGDIGPDEDCPVGINDETYAMGSFLLALLLPEVTEGQIFAYRARARRDLAVLAIALAIHRAENGSYPKRLGELAPKYLQAIPQDPFSGESFAYRAAGAGYVLYSVGQNARDDGGKDKHAGGDDYVVQTDK